MNNHYYHVSTENFGPSFTLHPRPIETAAEGEPEIDRVCLGPSLDRCFGAINLDTSENYYIYKTNNKIQGVKPHGVADSEITGEMWSTRKVAFKMVGMVPKEIVEKMPNNQRGSHYKTDLKKQRHDIERIGKLLDKFGYKLLP